MCKPYFGIEDIDALSETLTGSEHIYLGIRPYGFHAGNQLSLISYPLLLINSYQSKHNKPAKFIFFLFLNDYEQDQIAGLDLKELPFNVWPKRRILAHVPNKTVPSQYGVDYWCKYIHHRVATNLTAENKCSVIPIRNSAMKTLPSFKKAALWATDKREEIAEIIHAGSGRKVQVDLAKWILAVCPSCSTASADVTFHSQNLSDLAVTIRCRKCEQNFDNNFEHFDYWFYHKPLALPRLEEYSIDICFTGGDHFSEGDLEIRRRLIEIYPSEIKKPGIVFAPMVHSPDGLPLSKKRGTFVELPISLVNKYANTIRSESFQITQEEFDLASQLTNIGASMDF